MYKVIILLLILTCVLGCADLPKTKVNPIDGAEMVLVPAGEFLMGTTEKELAAWLQAHPDDQRGWFANEMPQHKVNLDAYYMYKTEVTVAQYRKFCTATNRKMPLEPPWKWQDTHPIVNVSWDDATAYAKWAGAALPTEAQWEKAARGTDGRTFPWGNDWDAGKAQCSKVEWGDAKSPAAVGSFAAGISPYGCLDMAGNVFEWCADWYNDGYYKTAPARNPAGPATGALRVFRSSSWYLNNSISFRAPFRGSVEGDQWNGYLGFRCVMRSP